MSLVYEGSVVVGSNPAGQIKPVDASGYYPVVLGAINTCNNAGDFYPAEPLQKILLESNLFTRRIKNRTLRGENGHPVREVGMTDEQYLNRILEIREERAMFHIKSIELDDKSQTDPQTGAPVVLVIGLIRPSGEKGEVLEKQLANPEENVYFSIRCLSTIIYDRLTGRTTRHITEVVTYDGVNEGGISYARKEYAPTVESDKLNIDNKLILSARDQAVQSGVSLESVDLMYDHLLKHDEILTGAHLNYERTAAARWRQ